MILQVYKAREVPGSPDEFYREWTDCLLEWGEWLCDSCDAVIMQEGAREVPAKCRRCNQAVRVKPEVA